MDSASSQSKSNPITINIAELPSEKYNELSRSYGTRYVSRNLQREAYIFHHQTFNECLKCQFPNSCSKDPIEMEAVLENTGFKVKVFKDLTMGQLRTTFKAISSTNHQNTDCLVIVVITSGREGFLYAQDGEYPIATLWDGFVGNRCPTLVGKPKLFFIQSRIETISDPSSGSDAQGEVANFTIPSLADVMVMYSCSYEDDERKKSASKALQNSEASFIQSLCDELRANGRRKELLEMLTTILRNIQLSAQGKLSVEQGQQIPIIVSTLTKELYFPCETSQ